MKILLIGFVCVFAAFCADCQPNFDSLKGELHRVAENDSLFKAFVMAHRRDVYSHPRATYELYRLIEALAREKALGTVEAVALDVQGIYFQNTGAFDSAELIYWRGLKVRQALGHSKQISQSYNNLGVLNRRRGRYDSALYYFHRSLEIAEAEQDSVLMSDYLSNLGLTHQNRHDYEEAVRYSLRSLAIREALRDTLKLGASYNNLGIIYNDLKDYDEARNYLEKSLAMKRHIGERKPIANTLVNLGSAYYYLGDIATAQRHLREAQSIFESLDDRQSNAATLDNLSFVARRANNLREAYAYSDRALMIRKEIGHPGDIITSSSNTARILIDMGRTLQAAPLLDEAYRLAREYGQIEPLRQVAQIRAYLYETIGDFRRAYQFQVEYGTLKDSLLNETNLSRIAELREQYEVAQKEQALELQQAKLLQQEAVILQRSQQRNFLMALTGAVVVIFVLVFASYRSRLKARDALNRKNAEMERIRSHFFANISHEFRTPLTLIQSMADELMEKQAEPALVKSVKSNANRLLHLVDQLLDLSRVDAGRLGIVAEHGDLSALIRALSGSFASLAAQKDIRYTLAIDENMEAYYDADKIEKIVINLLSNAFKFTPRGGAIELRACSKDDQLLLEIADTGPGIPQDEQTRIFDRFYQSKESHHNGTGIGLSLTRELIDLIGGTIAVESAEGSGTRFRVTLPLSREAFVKAGATFRTDAAESHRPLVMPVLTENEPMQDVWVKGDKPSVLIVEDNHDLRSYVKQVLSDTYDVLESVNGEEGLAIAEKVIPDLIISDIMMPVMDGVALCEKLKTSVITSHIPVILLTAKAAQEDKLKGLSTGADDYVIKPFSKEELKIRVTNLVKQREQLIAKFSQSLNPREIKLNSADEKFMKRLREIIEAHLDDTAFSVRQLSLEIGMSRTQLFRKIQALTGFSASEFMRVVRLNHAAEMLRNKTGSVSEIAYRVGFNNLSYFTKCFKARFGTTPGNYA